MEGFASGELSPRPTTNYKLLYLPKTKQHGDNLRDATPKKVNLGCFTKHTLARGLCHTDWCRFQPQPRHNHSYQYCLPRTVIVRSIILLVLWAYGDKTSKEKRQSTKKGCMYKYLVYNILLVYFPVCLLKQFSTKLFWGINK